MNRDFVSDLFNQTVSFGRIPLRRVDVYHHCIADGFSRKDADFIAFGCCQAIDDAPWSLDEFESFLADFHSSRSDET